VRAMPISAEASAGYQAQLCERGEPAGYQAQLCERGEPAVDDPEEVVEVQVAFSRCKKRVLKSYANIIP
jgi:hypothetical protein